MRRRNITLRPVAVVIDPDRAIRRRWNLKITDPYRFDHYADIENCIDNDSRDTLCDPQGFSR